MKTFFSSLLIVFATLFAAPAFADDACKNLFDPTKIDAEHYYAKTSGEYMYNNSISVSDLIPVTPGKKYTIFGRSSHSQTITHMHTFWDANREFVSGDYGPNTDSSNPDAVWTVTVPNNVSYLRFSFHIGDENTFQVEEGETATTYQPYNPLCATCDGAVVSYETVAAADVPAGVQNGTPSPTNPIEPTFYQQGDMVLRKVGDVADSYDAATGKITRRIGVKTFNGTEDITMFNTNSYIKSDASNVAYVLTGNNVGDSGWAVVSNVFSTTSADMWNQSGYPNTARINRRNQMHMNIANDVLGITDYTQETQESVMAKAKAFFKRMYDAGTPVTVYYVLETPVEETVTSTTYCADTIKIATTAYNSARFSPVVTDLNSAVATIRNVVTNTINQTAAIADLQATKQTRPDAECPRFRQCLLVEDNSNTPHWYLIKDPVRDLVKSLRDNKINSAGETTTTAYAANGYDGTNGTTDSRYYKGYVAMRELADGSSSVNNRQFGAALTGGDNGGQYKTLGDQEWAVTWDGAETGTAGSFLPGVIYGTSRCSKVKPSSTAVGTEGWTTIENSDPVNDAENIQSYVQCYCKMTGVGVDDEITPVRDSSRAPWVFYGTYGSAVDCAAYCAYRCAASVRDDASFRQRIMDWAVE